MNNDLISRESLKEKAETVTLWNGDVRRFVSYETIDNALTVEPSFGVFKAICCEECEKRPHGEWIAVKDKLPDKEGEYLVSLENGRIVVADDISIIENHDFEPKMLAWQALPEAYKKGGNERPQGKWEYDPPHDYARRFGKWQFLSGGVYKCNKCNECYSLHKTNYCSNCGAQMDKGGEV